MIALRGSYVRASRWRGLAIGAVLTLTVSACGSTVQWQDTLAEGESGAGLTDDGLSLTEDGLSVASPGPEDSGSSGAPDRGTEGDPGTTGSDGSVEPSPGRRGGSTTVPAGAPTALKLKFENASRGGLRGRI